jgi:hypothetical protein
MKRCLRLGPLAVWLSCRVPKIVACPICPGTSIVTTGQQLEIADQVVLTVPGATARQFRTVEVVRGNTAVGEPITEPVREGDTASRQSNVVLDPASHYAFVTYLQRSLRPDARVALESLPVVPAEVK